MTAAIFSLAANSQTLTQANNAMIIGDTYSTKQCDSTGISAGGNGPGQTWNFSTIAIHNSTIKNYTAVTVASTGSATSYPSAAVAVSAGPGANSFYSSTAGDYKYWGGDVSVGGVSAVLGLTSPAIYAAYPMSLSNSTTSATSGTLQVLGNGGTFTGNCTVTATGTGALQLPSATFPNAIKVLNGQVINFSSIVTGVITTAYYDYYSPANSKAPLLSIQTSTINSMLGNSTQTYVVINSNYIALGVKEQADNAAINLEAFPNPTKDNITVSFTNPSNETASLSFMNSAGQIVRVEELNSKLGINTQEIKLNNLASGIYFMIVKIGDKTAVKKISVQ